MPATPLALAEARTLVLAEALPITKQLWTRALPRAVEAIVDDVAGRAETEGAEPTLTRRERARVRALAAVGSRLLPRGLPAEVDDAEVDDAAA